MNVSTALRNYSHFKISPVWVENAYTHAPFCFEEAAKPQISKQEVSKKIYVRAAILTAEAVTEALG